MLDLPIKAHYKLVPKIPFQWQSAQSAKLDQCIIQLQFNQFSQNQSLLDLVYTIIRIEEGQKISVLLAKIMLYNLVTVLQYIRRACNNILKKGYNTCESLDGKSQLLVADKCRDK